MAGRLPRENRRELISCEVNMNQLSSYMNSIIQVVNQHAKLLDTVSYELQLRPVKRDIADMFNVVSHAFPYNALLQ